jgi:ABC-type transport system substrate-binding protein
MIVPNGITVEDATALRETMPHAVHIQPSAVFVFLQADRADARFARTEVRRALLMAIDRERILREAYAGGLARVAHTAVPDPLPAGLEPVPYDPARAKAELERLGMAGQAVKITHVASPQNEPMMAILVANLTEAGLVPTLEATESTLSAWRDGGHGGLVMHVMRSSRESDPRRYWNVPMTDGNYDLAYRSEAYDDEIHALVEREMRALYEERRDQLREQLFLEWSRRLPAIPLLFAAERVLVDPALHDWQTGPEIAFGRGMEKWWLEERAARPAAAPAEAPAADAPAAEALAGEAPTPTPAPAAPRATRAE